ncbi:feruloyl esterase B precursor [Melanomma pulvis-pyrius CBS 109.77]|uniref:Carboxylic ester hydrolase n=1 Tax=Melanomma pulvis-pyrius CBS 109.77 TaxID=1314802 RepID=A0A6A6X2M2_9PLEO|nr:feruloyl esterase B precursor [Melanomma pulvis-pyrius CBS 109.77]
MRTDTLLRYGALAGAAHGLDCSVKAIQACLPEGASVNFAYPLGAGSTFTVPSGDLGYPTNAVGLPALCAVSVQVQSIMNSSYGLGLFLPQAWNGRFLAVGNGGFAGGINWLDMGPGARYGFATMSTDTGHNSTLFDGAWAYNHPERVENWGHLAMHGSVVTSKIITSKFYKKKIAYNYYAGCSTGGRQGLKEAELYPEDFDGIIAGAPAWWTTHLQPWTNKIALDNLPVGADSRIPPALFPVIAAAVLKQCDPQDGLTDTIISDPSNCDFKPAALLCGSDNTTSTTCLTSPQIETLKTIYSDWISDNSTFLFPHLQMGSEGQWPLLAGAAPNGLGTEFVKYFLGLGPNWDFNSFTDEIVELAESINPGKATVKYDLSAFQKKGGKILAYHGLSDGLIPTGSTPYFYEQVTKTLNPRGINVDGFFRFFLVPGMGHCTGTTAAFNAPWYFAGPNQAPVLGPTVYSVPGFKDKDHDSMLAMMAWVEKGTAPDQIIGTKYVDESTQTTVLRQRPLCMYPKKAKYTGTGDVNAAKNWVCKA